MSAPRPQRVQELFDRALDLPPGEWDGFLRAECPGDEALRREVRALLVADRGGTPALLRRFDADASILADAGFDEPPQAGAPESVGPYRVLKLLGEGGFGFVYLAEQREPIRRRVAVKILKPGMDSGAIIRRFEAERQALAIMDHPGIARVIDAGATAQGRPYFVMEYVRGEPITDFCSRNRVDLRGRLDLFVEICGAIQHAHQKGVIHRDIKPSNILVTDAEGRPHPKVIDFGIAKAVGPGLSAHTVITEHGHLVGTPEYMSPEQAALGAAEVDTRTDIYSLGVLLYELLTGAVPFARKQLLAGGFAEVQRVIREVDPPRPSTRVLTGSPESVDAKAPDPRAAARLLRGDLDWITMKALEKSPLRRYPSASELAADIQHYLRDEPVSASPPSAAYQVAKFVRRNRGLVAAAGAVGAVLVLGLAGTLIGLRAAVKSRNLAEERAGLLAESKAAAEADRDVARAVNDLMSRLLSSPRPDSDGRTVTVYEVLRRPETAEEVRSAKNPRVGAAVDHLIASTLGSLGLWGEAQGPALRAYEGTLSLFGPDDDRTLEAALTLAQSLGDDRAAEAERLYRSVLLVPSPNHRAAARLGLAQLLEGVGRKAEAEVEYRALLDAETASDRESQMARVAFAGLLKNTGRASEAQDVLRPALDAAWKPGTHYTVSLIATQVGASILSERGRAVEGRALLDHALAEAERLLGPDSYAVRSLLGTRVATLRGLGLLNEALADAQRALEIARRNAAYDPESLALRSADVSRNLSDLGRHEEAAAVCAAVVPECTRRLGPAHPAVQMLVSQHANAVVRCGKPEEAILGLRRAIEDALAAGAPKESIQTLRSYLADLLRTRKPAEAVVIFSELLAERKAASEPGDITLLKTYTWLGQCLVEAGRYDEAMPYLQEGAAGLARAEGALHPETVVAFNQIAWAKRRKLEAQWLGRKPDGGGDRP